MKIETTYAVKLFFANSTFSQVYFEAVANAIDANANKIQIKIRTAGKIHAPERVEITVRDDGEGFTDERFDRFRQLKEPKDAYHKGLGRLVYLQYFSRVDISSVYGCNKRSFSFVHNFDGVSTVSRSSDADTQGTELRLVDFQGVRIKSYDDLKPSSLKEMLWEQFLPALLERKRQGKPVEISIELETDDANPQKEFFSDSCVLGPSDLPSFETTSVQDNSIGAFSTVEVQHSVQTGMSRSYLLTAVSVDGRTIPQKLIATSAVPAGTQAVFLFSSDIFTGKSDSARQRIILQDGVHEAALNRVLKSQVSNILSSAIPEIRTRNKSTQEQFENAYPHLIGLFDSDAVGLIDRNEAIEGAQQKFFQQQRQVIEASPTDDAAFRKSLELSARCLLEYVLYRDWVIQRLRQIRPEDLEATVHDLIAPRRSQFEASSLATAIYRNNAWVLDDKFMTFRTLLSESKMSDVIRAITLDEDPSGDEGRPDISMIFSADPDHAMQVDVVVVELKRKKIDDKEATYAGAQLVKRARKLVDYCPNIQRIWYYGIIEIDDDLSQLLIDMKWVPLFSKGRVFFQDFSVRRKKDGMTVPSPTFLLSFDAVTSDAAARNHSFLEILKQNFREQASNSSPAKPADE